MATYKLIQDIEAEDKILGPLTLRQFIFALITAFLVYLSFFFITKHLTLLLIFSVPPAILTTFFAFPFGRDQPTEVWALGKLRFWFKPRQRVWDQSGIKELVTINVPKKIQQVYTNGLSQSEVESRLKTLANTIDSRGWAVKNVNINNYYAPNPLVQQDSDRLLDINSVPQEVPDAPVAAGDDILDEANNPVAQQFDQMIVQSAQAHRQQLEEEMRRAAAAPVPAAEPAPSASSGWFMPSGPVAATPTVTAATGVVVDAAADDPALSAQLKAKSANKVAAYGHMRTINPVASQPVPAPSALFPAPMADASLAMPQPPVTTDDSVTAQPNPAIMALANNDDLNVATLAREAKKARGEKPGSDEVVISLH